MEKKEEKQSQKKETTSNPTAGNANQEKWLYGLAGFGLGCLSTYLYMDYKKNQEKANKASENERKEEQPIKPKRKSIL